MTPSDKLREIAKKYFPTEEKLSNNSLYNQLQQSSQDNLLSDLTALIESLLPSEEDVRMEFPMGGTMKAAYNRDYAEMIKDNQSRRLGAFWLRSRLLAAIDAKSIAQKPQENDKMLNKDAIDAKDDAKDLQDKH